MIKVVVTMEMSVEEKDAAITALKELVETTVQEEGCISYNFCQEANGSDSHAILETWANDEALDTHLRSEHFARLFPEISACMAEEPKIAIYRVLL